MLTRDALTAYVPRSGCACAGSVRSMRALPVMSLVAFDGRPGTASLVSAATLKCSTATVPATLRPGAKTDAVEAAVYEEIERLKKEPIADWELQKAKNSTRRAFISNLQSSLSRAINLTQYAIYYNDPGLINARLDKVAAVTKEDVQRVANKYLRDTNRTVVITMPKARTAAAATSGQ